MKNKYINISLFITFVTFFTLILYSEFIKEIPFLSGGWGYVHHGDSTENIRNAYFLSKGGLLNQYAISNHMPGVYFFLGVIYFISGIGLLNPSVNLLVIINFFTVFIMILVQVMLLVYSSNLIIRSKNLILYLIIYLIEIYLLIRFDYYKALSETLIPFVNLLSIAYFYKSLTNSKINKRKYLFNSLFFRCISIFLGLTNIIFDLLFLILIFLNSLYNRIIPYYKPTFVFSLIITSLLIILSDNLQDYFYWIFQTNKKYEFNNIILNIIFLPKDYYLPEAFGIFFDSPFYYLLMIIFTFYFLKLKMSDLLFCLLLFFLFQTDSWRISEGGNILYSQTYKNDSNVGIGLFGLFLFLNIIKINSVLIINKNKILFYLNLIFFLLVFKLNYNKISKVYDVYKLQSDVIRNSMNNIVCKQNFFRNNEYCKCINLMFWANDLFLINDILPCKYSFPCFSPHLNENTEYLIKLQLQMSSKEVSFLFVEKDLKDDTNWIDKVIKNRINLKTCKKINIINIPDLIFCNFYL